MNNAINFKDDPRLTTYALGELEALSADDIQEIETLLQESTEAQAFVDDIRLSAQAMQDLFAQEPPKHLPQRQRRKLVSRPNTLRTFVFMSVAALLMVGVGLVFTPMAMSAQMSRDQAHNYHTNAAHAPQSERWLYIDDASPPVRVSVLHGEWAEWHETTIALEGTANANNYNSINENNFMDLRVKGNDFSTFSIDVDTASYSDMRSHLTQYGRLPHAESIRIEEFINYFNYNYAGPQQGAEHPFRYHTESAICPWNEQHRLLRIAIQGKRIEKADRPATNLVFLIDVSGSMSNHNKLPLLKRSFKLLLEQLDERDNIAIVTYASNPGVALPRTNASDKQRILSALNNLQSGGSTNGAGGIQEAYNIARAMYDKNAENRVILATDGDFNVGISSQDALKDFITEQAKSGVFLNIHGYGMSNRQDGMMEMLSNVGNGTYAYIDTINEANKVMVEDLTGSLVTIAKDVKIQCVFNPKFVAGWRLIGYENRILAKEDFNDDTKDAGEIGAGHNVTALYEIIPQGVAVPTAVDPSPFTQQPEQNEQEPVQNDSPAWLQLRMRYKQPQADSSLALVEDIIVSDKAFSSASEGMRWASAVAGFGMMLKQSQHKGHCNWQMLIDFAQHSRGADKNGYRAECIRLMKQASLLQE